MIGLAVIASIDNQDSAKYRCSPDVVTDMTYDCNGLDITACKAARAANESACYATQTWSPSVYPLWVLAIAIAGYLAMLIVRTLGWIVQGFFARQT